LRWKKNRPLPTFPLISSELSCEAWSPNVFNALLSLTLIPVYIDHTKENKFNVKHSGNFRIHNILGKILGERVSLISELVVVVQQYRSGDNDVILTFLSILAVLAAML